MSERIDPLFSNDEVLLTKIAERLRQNHWPAERVLALHVLRAIHDEGYVVIPRYTSA